MAPVAVGRKAKVGEAVRAAEAATGIQFCVYLGPLRGDDAHAAAEAMFVERGLADRPGVLLLVAPKEHRVEIVTSPAAAERVPDEACRAAIDVMVEDFRRKRFDRGIVNGIEYLATVAGAGVAPEGAVDLPDVFE
ncbi:MAG TPA: TPM domain-containing protein [Acidimicrobiales bacterium]|nr:TPM domain-containing protein [Acidimicrobiales bacterium]